MQHVQDVQDVSPFHAAAKPDETTAAIRELQGNVQALFREVDRLTREVRSMRTSDDYRECIAIYPSGSERRASVLHVRLMTPEHAADELLHGRTAYIAPGDQERVHELYQPAIRQECQQ